MFIQTEPTQDPATLKFLPGRQVLAEGHVEVDKARAANSPLAERLFAIPEVAKVCFGKDTIAITKSRGEWQLLKPVIFGAIMEHFMSGAPTVRPTAEATVRSSSLGQQAQTSELVDVIKGALHDVIDPELGYNIADLGLIYDVSVEADEVCVTMTTTTPGCPATNYLGQGVSDKVTAVPGVASVKVKLTYEPRWTPEMMSPEAKAHFGIT
ncbi:MAG: NifU N-terminal domain-containing protein [Xanthobacteraceae bacterium]